MKVNFVQPDKKDNKCHFSEIKPGEIFSFSDPKASKTEIYMRIKSKDSNYPFDTVVLSDGRIGQFTDLKKEIISVDQLFVYRLNAEINVKVE